MKTSGEYFRLENSQQTFMPKKRKEEQYIFLNTQVSYG